MFFKNILPIVNNKLSNIHHYISFGIVTFKLLIYPYIFKFLDAKLMDTQDFSTIL